MQPCNDQIQQQPIFLLTLREVTEILIKQQNLQEGLYNLSFEFKIAVGTVGAEPESVYPGSMIGISRLGLSKTDPKNNNIHTVDAAQVNPLVKEVPKKKKTRKIIQ
ncbi:MAG: hypothetical protein HY881_26580 [Deltaproteobacteria bacterium]|nr:hypothetical protein [Deltaproteobacteria bacterium]